MAPPSPFVYHPELFEQLAEFNPEPTNFEIPKKKKKAQNGKKPKLGCSVMASPGQNTYFVDVKKCIPEGTLNNSTKFRGYASDRLQTQAAIDELDEFQVDLNFKVQKHFDFRVEKRGVIYQEAGQL